MSQRKEERGAILRRRTKHDDDLPDEIVLDILAELPVKSLPLPTPVSSSIIITITVMSYTFLGIFPYLFFLVLHILAIKSVLSLATAPLKPYPSLEFPSYLLGRKYWFHI
uniref:Uncharacterized protein n=1 Tax=Quercus lobata TaxID=97700 RepID=A0A7N2MJP3_QUELO